jgi:hypothetical protein
MAAFQQSMLSMMGPVSALGNAVAAPSVVRSATVNMGGVNIYGAMDAASFNARVERAVARAL